MIEPYQAQLIGYTLVAVIITVFGLEQYLKIKHRFFPKTPGKVKTNNERKNNHTTDKGTVRASNDPYSCPNILELRICGCDCNHNAVRRNNPGHRSYRDKRRGSRNDRNAARTPNTRVPQ